MTASLLADLVAILHGLIVLYVAGGAVLIVLGLWRKWAFARNLVFRLSHLLLCLGIVAFEWMGEACPLTTLERHFRAQVNGDSGFEGGFIAHYVSRTIHLNVPPEALALPTTFFVVLVAALYIWAGPRRALKQDVGKPKAAPSSRNG
ncbi:MAG: DUF2784 domain-containing protein [Planctomycetes bacterium]|nr:DUF2784 domain-containing protein [Planctomycetota bacterium]